MLPDDELCGALQASPQITVEQRLVRAVRHGILDKMDAQIIYPKASTLNDGQRYTLPGGAPGVYLAYEFDTAFAEVGAQLWNESRSAWDLKATEVWAVAAVDARVHHVVDLTDVAIQTALGTTVKELQSPWRFAPELSPGELPPTHRLARAAEHSSVCGFKYASSKSPNGHCLVVFYERLCAEPSSGLTVLANGRLRQIIGRRVG